MIKGNLKSFVKKISAIMLCASIGVMSACGGSKSTVSNDTNAAGSEAVSESSKEYEAKDISVAALKGPTGIGMVKLMQEAKNKNTANNYDFKISAAADEFTSSLIKGDIQIAALPSNAAATLYNKSQGKVKVLAVNTLGVLYIVENSTQINAVSDLKGKTIYLTGKGTTPEYTLRYLLSKAGIDPDKDVTLEFKSEAAEIAAIMAAGNENVVAMLPQPYVTTVMMNNDKVRIALDVTKEWEKTASSDSTVVTGVIAVNADYYENNAEAVEKFLEEYEASVKYVTENVDEAAQLVEEFDIFKAAVAKKAIPYCNITFIKGNEMKVKVSNYLKVLYDENPAAVGGSMPADEFYVVK